MGHIGLWVTPEREGQIACLLLCVNRGGMGNNLEHLQIDLLQPFRTEMHSVWSRI